VHIYPSFLRFISQFYIHGININDFSKVTAEKSINLQNVKKYRK